MYTITIENECSCFKKSGLDNNMTFETREDAHMKAKIIECRMNQEFCLKHFFTAVDKGDTILIKSIIRPEDDDEDAEDVKELMARCDIKIGFDPTESSPNG